jgi:micrococcal nuclease
MTMRIPLLACLLFLVAFGAAAEPVPSGAIQVIDGDTISARGRTVRLVGFDTPEGGINARCESECTLAANATNKLRQLVAGGGLDLSLVRCSCPTGAEGSKPAITFEHVGC